MSLDNMVKEKNELRDSNSQLKYLINALSVNMYALKETSSPVVCWAEISEDEMQKLIL